MKSIRLKARKEDIYIGDDYPIVVNCNIGANNEHSLKYEKEKIDILFSSSETRPNTMMDLSIFDTNAILTKYIINNYGIPLGVVPIYALGKDLAINKENLINQIKKYAELGVAFMTLHITADPDLYEIAKRDRKIPVTSRGGAMVLNHALINGTNNIYRQCINDIIELADKYKFAISLGTTFRPAGIIDACDEVHLKETKRQIEICHHLQKSGISVIIENVGHISLNNIVNHSKLLRMADAPIMPLGPIVIDSAIGMDHIASSIGAAFMGFHGIAHIINAISSAEHLSSFFSIENAKEAVISAKIAAKSVNINNFTHIMNEETRIYNERANKHSCIAYGTKECERCNILCPLKTQFNEA